MSTAVKLAGVCGWPIHHSLSPLLHNFWLKELGLAGAYVHFAVRPDEALRAFKSLKHTSISGVNVTIPLKSQAFEAADEHSTQAMELGVANCLYKENGRLIAHNTDMEGFAAPLIKTLGGPAMAKSTALVIGSGGAAKAVIGALLMLNVPEIRLCGRSNDKVDDIVGAVNVPSLYNTPWEDRHKALGKSSLVINASAGGMQGKADLDLDVKYLSANSFIYDLIYTPLKTKLRHDAEKMGCRTLGGLDMLIAQAQPSFKLFYGEEPKMISDPTPILIQALNSRAANNTALSHHK